MTGMDSGRDRRLPLRPRRSGPTTTRPTPPPTDPKGATIMRAKAKVRDRLDRIWHIGADGSWSCRSSGLSVGSWEVLMHLHGPIRTVGGKELRDPKHSASPKGLRP